jgi:hypothetical protein
VTRIALLQGAEYAQRPAASAEQVADAWRSTLTDLLESRVGARLADGVPAEALDDFERLVDSGDQAAVSAWFTRNTPDYAQVVAEEVDRLVVEASDWFLRDARDGGSRDV